MKATETQKEIAKYLHELTTAFGGVSVPLHLSKYISEAGAAIGLCVRSCFMDSDSYTVMLYLA